MSRYYLDQPTNPIHLNPAHKGKFTEWALRHGFRDVQEAARHVLANREHYSPEVVKMANFAHVARSWNHGDTMPHRSSTKHHRGGRYMAHDVADSEEVPAGEMQADDSEVDE